MLFLYLAAVVLLMAELLGIKGSNETFSSIMRLRIENLGSIMGGNNVEVPIFGETKPHGAGGASMVILSQRTTMPCILRPMPSSKHIEKLSMSPSLYLQKR